MKKRGLLALVMIVALFISPIPQLGMQVHATEDDAVLQSNLLDQCLSTLPPATEADLKSAPVIGWNDYGGFYVKSSMIQKYKYEVYRNGKLTLSDIDCFDTDGSFFQMAHLYSTWFNESGEYTFRVKAYHDNNYNEITDAAWSEMSSPITYNRPSAELPPVEMTWDSTNRGILNIPKIDNAAGYYMTLHIKTSYDNKTFYYEIDYNFSDYLLTWKPEINSYQFDFNRFANSHGKGEYWVTIIALSPDINVTANSIPMDSEVFDTRSPQMNMNDLLDDAISDPDNDTDDILDAIWIADPDMSATREAMQTNTDFLSKISDLEEDYLGNHNITVNTSTTPEASNYIDPNSVQIIGAGFTPDDGETITLNMGMTSLPEAVDGRNVQMDIKLTIAGEEVEELYMPVTITMPVPTGIDVSKLRIQHKLHNGTFENVSFINNGNGTITFTITECSTFIFKEVANTPANPSGNSSPTQDTNKSSVDINAVISQLNAAKAGDKITIKGEKDFNTLPSSVIEALLKNPNASLLFTYTYEGKDYEIFIPAGKAIDLKIPYYGPLCLAGLYGNQPVSTSTYTVRKGDTLGKIARVNKMKLSELLKLNPQITNPNRIKVNQLINVK